MLTELLLAGLLLSCALISGIALMSGPHPTHRSKHRHS